MKKELSITKVIDLLLLDVATKDLLPDSKITYCYASNPSVIEGFVGIQSVAPFDLEEIRQNIDPERYVDLDKHRLIDSYMSIIDFAEARIKQLEDNDEND